MAYEQQAPWVGGTVGFFAVSTAVAFGCFIHFYTMNAHLSEQRVHKIIEHKELEVTAETLRNRRQPLEIAIAAQQQRLADITTASNDAKNDNTNLLEEQAVRISSLEASTQKISRDYKIAIKEAKEARLEMLGQEQNTMNSGADLEAKLINYRAQIKTESRVIEAFQKQTRAELYAIDRSNIALTKRVRALIGQQELSRQQLQSDAKVLTARATDGYLIMNIGRDTGLRIGTIFKIFARSGGKNIEKGTAEVTHVGAIQSEARILNEISHMEPIIPGDNLHNPVFDPNETKVFVISGIFTNFSRKELTRFITESGATVDKELSNSTHYLVAGDGSDADTIEASRFGINIISEDQLINFIRPPQVTRQR